MTFTCLKWLKKDSFYRLMRNINKNADFIYHYSVLQYFTLLFTILHVQLDWARVPLDSFWAYNWILLSYCTFPLLTPENDTPCLAIISAGSLKYRGTRDQDVLLNSSKLSISPENTSVTTKVGTLKEQQRGLELCIWAIKKATEENSSSSNRLHKPINPNPDLLKLDLT